MLTLLARSIYPNYGAAAHWRHGASGVRSGSYVVAEWPVDLVRLPAVVVGEGPFPAAVMLPCVATRLVACVQGWVAVRLSVSYSFVLHSPGTDVDWQLAAFSWTALTP